MMRRSFYTAIFLATFATAPARAELAVASGGRVTLATMSSLDQVCHSLGRYSVGVIEQPHAGTIVVDYVNGYPNFPAINTRSRCNTLRLPLTRVTYQSTGGYVGQDEAMIEVVAPNGAVRRLRFTLSVRPGVILIQPPAPEAGLRPHRVAKSHTPVTAVARSIAPERHVALPHAHKKPKPGEHPISI